MNKTKTVSTKENKYQNENKNNNLRINKRQSALLEIEHPNKHVEPTTLIIIQPYKFHISILLIKYSKKGCPKKAVLGCQTFMTSTRKECKW